MALLGTEHRAEGKQYEWERGRMGEREIRKGNPLRALQDLALFAVNGFQNNEMKNLKHYLK